MACYSKGLTPRPVMLAHMDQGSNNHALVAFLYNDDKVPEKQVCFDYEGPDAVDRAGKPQNRAHVAVRKPVGRQRHHVDRPSHKEQTGQRQYG